MLTDGAGGNPSGPGSTGDSLLEELNRDEENQENFGLDDDVNTDDKQAWINAQRYLRAGKEKAEVYIPLYNRLNEMIYHVFAS